MTFHIGLLIIILLNILGVIAFIMQHKNSSGYESNPERKSNDYGAMTQNFFMCGSSQATYDSLKDKNTKYTFAQMEDQLLGIERDAICNYRNHNKITPKEKCLEAKKLSQKIKKLTGKDLDYHSIHLKAICTPNDHSAPSKNISTEKLCNNF